MAPLMLNAEFMWDGSLGEMAYITQNTEFLKPFLKTQFTKYYIALGLNELSLLTGIYPKVFLNVITVASVCGIAFETFKYLRRRIRFDETYAYLGAWVALVFPVWHSLASGVTFQSILSVWLFMIAVNLWRKKPLLALLFFIPSLQFFSIFSLAVGFAGAEFVLSVSRENYKREFCRTVLFGIVLACVFLPIYLFADIHAASGNYNTFTLTRLSEIVTYFLVATATLGVTFWIGMRMKDREQGEQLIRCVLAVLIIGFFSAFAYWAVGRPMRFFNFGSFSTRFSYLTSIPFAMGVATFGQFVASRWSGRTRFVSGALLITALIVVMHQGHSHKIAAVVFKEMLTESFQAIEEPPSGFVIIKPVGYEAPRHVHMSAINLCLYRAYGRGAWMANGYWRRHMKLNRASLESIYVDEVSRRMQFAIDVTGDAYSEYEFRLEGYHQEGRFWYLWYYLTGDYGVFKPQLVLVRREE